jgi:ligand-binding sensor domain-containing protein
MPLPLLSNSYALLIAGLLAISSSVGQSENRDPHFTPTAAKSTSYMPRVIIRNMREDRAGNIWFATFGGAIRYDGKEFANFSEEVGLAKTRIFSLLEARSGALWFGSITGGASRYDGKSFKKFTEKEGLGNNDVMWIFEDRDANIWFGTGNGVSRYDGKSMTNFTTKEGLVDNSVYTIAQDASGRIWFGTQGGVCSYDGKSFSNLADQVGRPFVNVRSMVVDRSGNLWFGGQEGAFRYDGKTLATFTSKEGLLDDFVGSMIIDRAGNLWFGHPGSFPDGKGGGASRYDGKSLKRFTQKEGLSSLTVYCMLEDKAGNIWFGSADAGACRYDGKTFTNFSATNPPRLPARPAQAPANDQTSAIAKGEAVSEMSKSIWSVFQDKNHNHWFGSDGQGVYRYDGKTITNFTTKHGLWMATVGGVWRYDGESMTHYSVKDGSRDGWLVSNYKDNRGELWLGSIESGAYRFNGKTFETFKP